MPAPENANRAERKLGILGALVLLWILIAYVDYYRFMVRHPFVRERAAAFLKRDPG